MGKPHLHCHQSRRKAGDLELQQKNWDWLKLSSFYCSKTSKFPLLNSLQTADLLSNLQYFARILMQTNPKEDTSYQKQTLTTLIRFSWSPFWCLDFFSLSEEVQHVTTYYTNLQKSIINSFYTAAGSWTQLLIHNTITNWITKDDYRDRYGFNIRSSAR